MDQTIVIEAEPSISTSDRDLSYICRPVSFVSVHQDPRIAISKMPEMFFFQRENKTVEVSPHKGAISRLLR